MDIKNIFSLALAKIVVGVRSMGPPQFAASGASAAMKFQAC